MATSFSPPLARSPRQPAPALHASKSDTNLAGSAFAVLIAPSTDGATSQADDPNTAVAAAAAAAAGGHHTPLIPSYPYNLSMSAPFIPGCSSSDPRLFEQHAPDDSSVQSRLPAIAVDYLSHDWKEDDVWASWKAMTKHKSELANGVRLENASWRTWAKQRGKLKTISPETLNWLKDSDVTWLYGPLHTAVDPVPPPRQATTAERLGLSGLNTRKGEKASARSYSTSSSTRSGHHGVPLNVKPILKHRSLSDILSVPNNGSASPSADGMYGNSEDEDSADARSTSSSHSSAEGASYRDPHTALASQAGRRPGILRTPSSDSSHGRKNDVHPHGFDSDSGGRSQSPDVAVYPPAPQDLPSSARSSFRRTSSQDHFQPKKRHIVFNHRVERCISLDAEEVQAAINSGSRAGKQPYSNALQRYGSHQASSSSSSSSASSSDDEDDDDDDDDDAVLTFKSSSPKSPSFIKPFLPSPTGSGPGSSGSGQDGKKIAYGTHGPHGQDSHEPHTIAPLEPTTLKDSELMPGPTPIVVYQDGKITAFYGTEDDYVYDAEEHGGIPHWVPVSAADLGGTAVADEEDEEHLQLPERSAKAETEAADDADELHYDSAPASSIRPNPADRDAVLPTSAKSMNQNDPTSTSSRYTSSDTQLIAGADGQVIEPQMETAYKTGYFGGPESAVHDDYDIRQVTASQAQFGHTSQPHPGAQYYQSHPISTSSSNSSSEVTLSGTSPGTGHSMLYSASPSGSFRGPTKSILKKGRDPSQPGSADYYPPMPPAVTRASRAHAQMFDDNGEEVVSPQRAPIRLPETATLAEDGSASSSLVLDSGSSQALSTNIPYSGQLGLCGASATSPLAGQPEPTRGRSISRGNSSSSLYERAQSAAAAAEYRSRSQSGGSSISPVASYSPPFTSSLNSLGAGTAVMPNHPAGAPRGRNVQTARPSTRREALSDTSSDQDTDGSSTETDSDGEDDEGQAAGMEFGEDAHGGNFVSSDSVHFARQHGPPHGHASIQQSHSASLNDDDDAEVEQVSSPEGTRGTLSQSDFESRPVNAASAGRVNDSLPSLTNKEGKQAHAALPTIGSKDLWTSLNSDSIQVHPKSYPSDRKARSSAFQVGERRKPEASKSPAVRDFEDSSEADERLFDSPYMPSSPRITSSTNLGSLLRSDRVSDSEHSEPYTLTWADKDDRPASGAQGSLMQSLVKSAQRRPAWLGKGRNSGARKDMYNADQLEDDLSDPANNGYSYDYGFDEDDGDQKGYVAKAADLLGALWNVGTEIVWGRGGEDNEVEKATLGRRSP